MEKGEECVLAVLYVFGGHIDQLLTDAGRQRDDLLGKGERMPERLLQKLHQHMPLFQLVLGRLIQIRRELGEDLHLAVLREVDTERSGRFFHGLRLCGAAHTGYGKSYIDGGALSFEEQVTLEKNLSVSDGYDVGRNVCRHVAVLRLDDRQCGDGAAAEFIGKTRTALKQS